MKIDLVVTRHQALVEFLLELGIITDSVEVITHITDSSVLVNKNVLGILPVRLAFYCSTYLELDLHIPKELRGTELTISDLRKYYKGILTFKVERI